MIIAGIPAYNEEKTIARVILTAQRHVDMVVVADDGSTDLTSEVAHRLGAVVIHHDRNMGYGAAIISLFEKAKAMNADALITLDSDGQHDAGDIPSLLQPILENRADIIVGSRFVNGHNGNGSPGVPLYRRFGIKLLTRLSNGNGKHELLDGQSGFRAYNRKALQNLRPKENGMGVSAEIMIQAGKKGLKVTEVPINVNYNGLDTSTHNPVRHGLSVMATVLKLVVEERPLFYLGIPGAIMFLIGLLFDAWTFQLFTIENRIVTNVALTAFAFTLIGLFALFTAVTLYAIVRLTQKQQETS